MADMDRGDFSLPSFPLCIVAVDLGETTGVAIYDLHARTLKCSSTDEPSHLFPTLEIIKPSVLILERFPESRNLSFDIALVYGSLLEQYTSVLVSPGEWKPVMKTRKFDHSMAKNQHERDAIDMIRYYIFSQWGEELE